MGRHATPTSKLKLTGAYRNDRHGDRGEPTHAPGVPSMPSVLTGYAAKEWDRIIGALDSSMLTKADRAMLAAYCVAVSQWRESQEIIDRDGLLLPGHNGSLRRNPALMIQKQAMEVIVSVSARFGLTPADRARMKLGEKKGDDPLADLLASRNA